jgi:pilus assembly protein Flp/PilA
MLKFFRGVVKSQEGATAVEYGLIVSLIVVAIMGAMSTVADSTINMWNGVSENIVNATE